jgi:hypothetical protein
MKEIRTVADVEAIREQIEEFASELWAVDEETGRVDWEDWFERFERHLDVGLPDQWDDPAIRAVKRIAKQAIQETIRG